MAVVFSGSARGIRHSHVSSGKVPSEQRNFPHIRLRVKLPPNSVRQEQVLPTPLAGRPSSQFTSPQKVAARVTESGPTLQAKKESSMVGSSFSLPTVPSDVAYNCFAWQVNHALAAVACSSLDVPECTTTTSSLLFNLASNC